MLSFDLRNMQSFPYQQRDKNVFYEAGNFKTRIIELQEGEKFPPHGPCEMASYAIYYLVSGKIGININGEYSEPEEGHCMISGLGSYQMEAKDPAKILGIQIQPKER